MIEKRYQSTAVCLKDEVYLFGSYNDINNCKKINHVEKYLLLLRLYV